MDLDAPKGLSFELSQLRRKFTKVNTHETRENWFKGYDFDAEKRLKSDLMPLPEILNLPEPQKSMSRDFPKELVVVLVLMTISSVASLKNDWFLLLHLIPIAVLLRPLRIRGAIPRLCSLDKEPMSRRPIRIVWSIALLFLANGAESDSSAERARVISLCLVVFIAVFDLKSYLDEKKRNKSHNLQMAHQAELHLRSLEHHQFISQRNKTIHEKIDALPLECLELPEMLKIRRSLLDQALEVAFAELGISREDQTTVASDRDRFVLEITGPTSGSGPFVSPYEQPIIQFISGLPRNGRYDSPALTKYLSHLYVCRIGIVLPQGFGYFEAIVDSVKLEIHPRGHELLLWKAISRVTRSNAGDELEADKISIQTYGGSETVLPVNGMYISEQQEKVQTIDATSFDELGISEESQDSDYRVNSFVLSIQQRMAAAE